MSMSNSSMLTLPPAVVRVVAFGMAVDGVEIHRSRFDVLHDTAGVERQVGAAGVVVTTLPAANAGARIILAILAEDGRLADRVPLALDTRLQEPGRARLVGTGRQRFDLLLAVAGIEVKTGRCMHRGAGSAPPSALEVAGRTAARRRRRIGAFAVADLADELEVVDLALVGQRGIPQVVFTPEAEATKPPNSGEL